MPPLRGPGWRNTNGTLLEPWVVTIFWSISLLPLTHSFFLFCFFYLVFTVKILITDFGIWSQHLNLDRNIFHYLDHNGMKPHLFCARCPAVFGKVCHDLVEEQRQPAGGQVGSGCTVGVKGRGHEGCWQQLPLPSLLGFSGGSFLSKPSLQKCTCWSSLAGDLFSCTSQAGGDHLLKLGL